MQLKKGFFRQLLFVTLAFGAGYYTHQFGPALTRKLSKSLFPPKVSIVLPTYNRAKALPIAVDSMLAQTFTDFELIIINDGSKDETDEILKKYAARDKRVVYLKNEENRGLVYSLNRGLAAARGKYIARMDDDDKSVPYRLEREVLAMDAHPEITILGSGMMVPYGVPKKETGVPKIDDPDETELNTYFTAGLAHPTIIIRHSFLKKHQLRYNPAYLHAEDTAFYRDVLKLGGKITQTPEKLLWFAYTSNVERPEKYYQTQYETFKRVQKEKFSAFFTPDDSDLGSYLSESKKCQILTKMIEPNKQKKILNQATLEKRQKTICTKVERLKTAIKVSHPFWEDHIYVDPDKKEVVRLFVDGENGVVTAEDKKTATVKWEKWPAEVFEKVNRKTWRYLQDADGTVKSKKD